MAAEFDRVPFMHIAYNIFPRLRISVFEQPSKGRKCRGDVRLLMTTDDEQRVLKVCSFHESFAFTVPHESVSLGAPVFLCLKCSPKKVFTF